MIPSVTTNKIQSSVMQPSSEKLPYPPRKGRYVDNIPYRVEEELETEQGSSAAACLHKFQGIGGSLINIKPLSNTSQELFALFPGDIVYPSCSAGYCRSQTLWHILSPFSHRLTLFAPHATRMGFDPFNGKANWCRNEGREKEEDQFKEWAGRDKAVRFGFELFSEYKDLEYPSDELLGRIKSFYDQHYFGPGSLNADQQARRRVYITFAQNAHAILFRLIQSNERLDNVVVVHVDLDDYITAPHPDWHTTSKSREAYARFAQVLHSLLDLSRLS